MKKKIRSWTTSYNQLVYDALYKEWIFWHRLGVFNTEKDARGALEKFEKNKQNEKEIYL